MKCSVFIAVSVDGFIAGRGESLAFLDRVQEPGEDYGYQAFFDDVDCLVVGRKTWDVVRGFEREGKPWLYEGKRVVVLTRGAFEPAHGATSFAGDVAALARALAEQGVRRVYVDGGQAVRAFLAAGLVDDLTLSVIPVLLGSGVPLFGDASIAETRLSLTGVESYDTGLVQLRYARG